MQAIAIYFTTDQTPDSIVQLPGMPADAQVLEFHTNKQGDFKGWAVIGSATYADVTKADMLNNPTTV